MSDVRHVPTDDSRKMVRLLSGVGVPQDDICVMIGVSKPTLHKYYRHEIDIGLAEANAKVAQTLFKQATSGNISAAIFWAKARMGWREKQEVEITGKDGGPVSITATTVDARTLEPEHREALKQALLAAKAVGGK